jgi:hypothetical protein
MAQHDYNIANDDGAGVRTDINDLAAAIKSGNSHASTAPSSPAQGMIWWKTVDATNQELYYYDGADWILILRINPTTNALTFNFPNSQSITGDLNVTGVITSLSTDAGAGGGPYVTAFRNSASPAASDIIGGFLCSGKDSNGNTTSYALFDALILDPTDGSEDARARFVAMVGGTLTQICAFGPGFQIGIPTGGDKGAGSLNVDAGVYIDGAPVGATETVSADKGGAGADTLTSATPVKITFGTENWDIGGTFASSTWTPTAGKKRIDTGVELAATNGVDNEAITLHLYKNGSLHRELVFKRSSTTAQSVNGSWIVDANGTDTFEIYVTKGGAGNGATTTTAARNYFQGSAL